MSETEPAAAGDSPQTGLVSSPVPVPKPPENDAEPAATRSFDALYTEFFPFVWRCLRALGVREAGLDDAAQDVFFVVHRRFADFRQDSSVRTWLYGIVRNVAANHRRTLQRKGRGEPLDLEIASRAPSPAEHAELAEATAFVSRFLDGLDAKKREIFFLALVEEMSIPEVAKALSIPLNTAYTRLRLVRADFQLALAKEAPR